MPDDVATDSRERRGSSTTSLIADSAGTSLACLSVMHNVVAAGLDQSRRELLVRV